MNKSVYAILASSAALLSSQTAQAYYSEPASYKSPALTVTLSSSQYPTNTNDDSAALNQAIQDVATAGGGIVWIPKDDYDLQSISLQSNVHLQVEAGTNLSLIDRGTMFSCTSGQQNTSIRGIGGRFNVHLPNVDSARVVIASDTENLLIKNINVQDPHETVHSSIELSWNKDTNGTPNNVTIENVDCLNKGRYGYGIVQAQAASNTLFKNLKGIGGVPVRLETGWKTMNLAHAGGVFGIKIKNITSEDGQSAVMMGPHTRQNGDVFINYVTAIGSQFAVNISGGGTWKYTDQQIEDHNLTAGSFGKISIGNATATYHESGVPTKWATLDLYPETELEKVFRDSNEVSGYSGPSIAVIGNYGDYASLTTWQVKGIGNFVNPWISDISYDYPGWKKDRPAL